MIELNTLMPGHESHLKVEDYDFADGSVVVTCSCGETFEFENIDPEPDDDGDGAGEW